jgi:hypothetical protein
VNPDAIVSVGVDAAYQGPGEPGDIVIRGGVHVGSGVVDLVARARRQGLRPVLADDHTTITYVAAGTSLTGDLEDLVYQVWLHFGPIRATPQ